MIATTLAPKQCAICPKEFYPRSSFARACSQRCAMKLVKADAKAKEQREKAEFKARKEAIKTIAYLIEDAQYWFNRFIRLRDADQPCFCCGKPFEPQKRGGSMDAGHLRSRGSATHLRFTETNCFAQRKNCNRPGGATEEAKKAGAALRVGQAEVDRLYAENRVHKWQRDELIAIRETYKAKCRQIEKERA